MGPTVYGATGLVHQTVAFQDAVVVSGFPPGHVDRGGGELTKVDEARSRGRYGTKTEVDRGQQRSAGVSRQMGMKNQ